MIHPDCTPYSSLHTFPKQDLTRNSRQASASGRRLHLLRHWWGPRLSCSRLQGGCGRLRWLLPTSQVLTQFLLSLLVKTNL
ncbi:hypothetical protein BJX76DRAFT_327986 [Aspergillus varians]